MIVSQKMAQDAWGLLGQYSQSSFVDNDILEARGKPDAPDIVNHVYRSAAKRAHPDSGGSAEAFAAVDRAKHVLLAWLDRQSGSEAASPAHGGGPCPKCHGSGHLTLRKGFREMRYMCPTCKGSGEADVEQEKESW